MYKEREWKYNNRYSCSLRCVLLLSSIIRYIRLHHHLDGFIPSRVQRQNYREIESSTNLELIMDSRLRHTCHPHFLALFVEHPV